MSTVSYGTFLGDMSIGPNGTGLRGAFSPNSTRTAHSRRRRWTDTLLDTLPSILSQTKGPTVGSEIPKWFEASTLTDHDEIAAQITIITRKHFDTQASFAGIALKMFTPVPTVLPHTPISLNTLLDSLQADFVQNSNERESMQRIREAFDEAERDMSLYAMSRLTCLRSIAGSVGGYNEDKVEQVIGDTTQLVWAMIRRDTSGEL